MILFEFFDDPFDQPLVDVVTAQVRVTVRRFHFDYAFANFQDRNVIGATAKVEHRDRLVFFLIKTVSQGSRGRLVHDAHYFQARDLAGVFRRLTLRVVEVSRHGDNRFLNFLSQIILGGLFHLLKDHR